MESGSLDKRLPLGRGEEGGVREECDEKEAKFLLFSQRHLLHNAADHWEQLRQRERATGWEKGGTHGLLEAAELLQMEQLRMATDRYAHLVDSLQYVDDAEVVVAGLAEGQRVLQVPTLRCTPSCRPTTTAMDRSGDSLRLLISSDCS